MFENKKAGAERAKSGRGACDRGSFGQGNEAKGTAREAINRGIDISTPALSLLKGQKRPVMDFELNTLADILGVSVDWLLGREAR